MDEHVLDELLEAIWTCREEGIADQDACLDRAHTNAGPDSFSEMQEGGYVKLEGQTVRLTHKGDLAAASLIRRHRLAERLFADVLGLSPERTEIAACSFEHTGVVPEVTEGLCTLLGHPQDCPHGKPIPPGACCQEGRTEVASALLPLSEVPFGRSGRVAYVRPQYHDRLHMLLSMGLAPGVGLRIHQRTPVLVIKVDESEIAMDREVAGDVYVWLDPNS